MEKKENNNVLGGYLEGIAGGDNLNSDDGKEIVNSEPMGMLKLDMISFLSSYTKKVEKMNLFLESVQRALQEKIDKGEIDANKLMLLYSNINSDLAKNYDEFFSLIKPNNEDDILSRLFFGLEKRNNNSNGTDVTNLDHKDQELISLLAMAMAKLNKGDVNEKDK